MLAAYMREILQISVPTQSSRRAKLRRGGVPARQCIVAGDENGLVA
jgi:hypothetical protein